jgi:hypothetical protein
MKQYYLDQIGFETVLAGLFLGLQHKVRTYKEYHSVCSSSELGLSQPLSRQRVFPSPQKQGGGGTLACGWGVEGSPNSDEGHTLWYSLYVRTLWTAVVLRIKLFVLDQHPKQ